ncbi:MAG TPA: glutamate--tRNA ligase family protein [Bdellovibrionota bacterium]|nr:glutamate--tRNA ligase family protein [Bdellovibrionota bacterium]
MGIRFAPSPTGAFHVGNLRTAWISWTWSRALGQPWVVRFEDIDGPRVVPGARERQLADLKALGLEPDRSYLQSERHARHRAAFERAVASGALYPCYCSRKEIRAALDRAASAPHAPQAQYDGRCRSLSAPPPHPMATIAWRFRREDPSGKDDFIVARTSSRLGSGGVPLQPETFAPSYHWACAVDDHDGGYSLLVRASDLASAAESQRAVQAWLAASEGRPFRPPAIFHCSLVVRNDGHRLEKRTAGVTLPELEAAGIGPRELRAKFEAGFEVAAHRRGLEPGRLFGEDKETLTLRELGL